MSVAVAVAHAKALEMMTKASVASTVVAQHLAVVEHSLVQLTLVNSSKELGIELSQQQAMQRKQSLGDSFFSLLAQVVKSVASQEIPDDKRARKKLKKKKKKKLL